MTKRKYRFGDTFIKNHAPKLLAAVKLHKIKTGMFAGSTFQTKKNRHAEYQALAFMTGVNK